MMLAFGYLVVAAAFYAAVRRFSPQMNPAFETPTMPMQAEIIELYPADVKKVA